eukprot:2435880-Amphidinium_carterae.1
MSQLNALVHAPCCLAEMEQVLQAEWAAADSLPNPGMTGMRLHGMLATWIKTLAMAQRLHLVVESASPSGWA